MCPVFEEKLSVSVDVYILVDLNADARMICGGDGQVIVICFLFCILL